MKSPLRWPGGKRLLAPTILRYLSAHRAYVETCCGGAAVFWAKPRSLSSAEILNDADGELINFYYVLQKHGRRLAREVDSMPYSRALLNRLKLSRPRAAFQRAVRFWYLNRVAFGGGCERPTFGVKATQRASVLTASILGSLDATIERLRGVSFEAVDVVRLLELYDRRDTLFYVDPPYYGLSQRYSCRFALTDHIRLARALGNLEGAYLLSYNDCPEVRRLYVGLHRRKLTTRYTLGCNSRSGGHRDPGEPARELLISNRPLRQVKVKLATPRPRNDRAIKAPLTRA